MDGFCEPGRGKKSIVILDNGWLPQTAKQEKDIYIYIYYMYILYFVSMLIKTSAVISRIPSKLIFASCGNTSKARLQVICDFVKDVSYH